VGRNNLVQDMVTWWAPAKVVKSLDAIKTSSFLGSFAEDSDFIRRSSCSEKNGLPLVSLSASSTQVYNREVTKSSKFIGKARTHVIEENARRK
jgi:hypothetical protein